MSAATSGFWLVPAARHGVTCMLRLQCRGNATAIEPAAKGHDIRSFECPVCQTIFATGGAAGPDAAQGSSRGLIGAALEQDPRSRIRPDSVSCINAAQSPHSSKFVLPFAR